MKSWKEDFCILEIVTTGPDPETARPVEGAALRVCGGVEVDSVSFFMDPGSALPPSLLERSGREEGDYRGGCPPAEGLSRLCGFCGTRAMIAHEGSVMESEIMARYGIRSGGLFLDSRELAWLVLPYLRDHSLPSLASSLLHEYPSWKALEDARLLARILTRLEESWEEIPSQARAAISGALREAESPWRFVLAGGSRRRAFPALVELVPTLETTRRGEEAPPAPEGAVEVDVGEVVSILEPGGALAASLSEHEFRPQQVAMARAVAAAMNDGAFLVVEAGTGVGKSLAYLVPGVLHARASGSPLVVSTYTRNLQEQLHNNDLPLLARSLGSVEFCLLKGRGNYLCLRKWSAWCASLAEGDLELPLSEVPPGLAYAFMASWLSRTPSGDLEEISLGLRSLVQDLLPALCSSSEDCLGPRCRYRYRCFVERARAQGAKSEVVVVNHALLLSQIEEGEEGPGNLVLPDYRLLVVDEAHHLEDVATDAFTLSYSQEDCLAMLQEVAGNRGLLARWAALPLDSDGLRLLAEAREEAERVLADIADPFAHAVEGLLPHARQSSGGGAENLFRLHGASFAGTRWENVQETGLELAAALDRLSADLASLAEKVSSLSGAEEEEEALRLEGRRGEALAAKAAHYALALQVFLRDPDGMDFGQHLRWLETSQRKAISHPLSFRLKSAPASVGEPLSSLLFAPLRSAILTSASLRAPGGRQGFQFFLCRSGLDLADATGREVRLLALDSPFDYASQVRLLALTDLPEPAAREPGFTHYMQEVSRVVEDVVLATGGKALVLLTSHQQVDFLHAELGPRLEERGLPCLRQRKRLPNALLLERFRSDRDSVLLATEAFWEGVDVPGESLSAVIVAKLPFRRPDDPVVAGRMEYRKARGEEAWKSYYIPLAVTLFRQGIGRLVRRSTDRGIIVVLDPRFLTRPYARDFQDALPAGLRVERVAREDLHAALRRRAEA